MLPEVHHNGPPPQHCLCGKKMHHATWTELALEGGTRPYTGVACDTDGCPGNFPQFWKKIIEDKKMSNDSLRKDLEEHPELSPMLDVNREGNVVAFGWLSPVYDYLPEEESDGEITTE